MKGGTLQGQQKPMFLVEEKHVSGQVPQASAETLSETESRDGEHQKFLPSLSPQWSTVPPAQERILSFLSLFTLFSSAFPSP